MTFDIATLGHAPRMERCNGRHGSETCCTEELGYEDFGAGLQGFGTGLCGFSAPGYEDLGPEILGSRLLDKNPGAQTPNDGSGTPLGV